MGSAQDVPGGDAKDKEAGEQPGRNDSMGEHAPCVGVEDDGAEALKLGSAVAENEAYGILHEAVGDNDPQGREVAADDHEPAADAVGFGAQFLPAEDPHREERGFHEERDSGFDGQQGTEDIADKFRIARPVGAELEFEGDACDDTQRKVDEKKFSPEFCVS